jgi:hypothetical protein
MISRSHSKAFIMNTSILFVLFVISNISIANVAISSPYPNIITAPDSNRCKTGPTEVYRCVDNKVHRLYDQNCPTEHWITIKDCNQCDNSPCQCIGGVCVHSSDINLPIVQKKCDLITCPQSQLVGDPFTENGKDFQRFKDCSCIDGECKCISVKKEIAIEKTTPDSVQKNFAISGKVFDDKNDDGSQSSGEQGLQGLEIRLERPDGSMISKVTDENGHYEFDNLPIGSYRLKVSAQEGWTATVPAEESRKIDLTDSREENANFGFMRLYDRNFHA